MQIRGKNSVRLEDILIGEVWVCSGQSNMQWPMTQVENAHQEITTANHGDIRLFSVTRTTSEIPLNDVAGYWKRCSPQTVGSFSAVGYFHGRELQRELGVPVGLINSSWGGTRIEPWTDRQRLQKVPDIDTQLAWGGTELV